MTIRGKYIVFEGLDGSGKTSQVDLLEDWLRGLGAPVQLVREPCTPESFPLDVRDFLAADCKLDRLTIEYTFQASRVEHLRSVEALLASGTHVVSDRSYISGQVYAEAAGLSGSLLAELSRAVPLKPDFLVYLDVTPEKAMGRILDRGGKLTRDETLESLTRVSQIYTRTISEETTTNRMHWARIDGGGNKTKVAFAIRASIDAFLDYAEDQE